MALWHAKTNRYLKVETTYEAEETAQVSSYDFTFILRQWLILIVVIIVAIFRGGETSVTSALAPSDNDAGNDKVDHGEEEDGGNDKIDGTWFKICYQIVSINLNNAALPGK